MLTSWLLILLGVALILLLLAAIAHAARPQAVKDSTVTRAAVYLVLDGHLLIMQQQGKGGLRSRLEVPKGKVKAGERALDGALRECVEESGLRPTDLQFLTAIEHSQDKGKQRGKETWHAFWGSVPADTSIPFEHRVQGTGRDRDRIYSFRLVPLETVSLHPPLDNALPALRRAVREESAVG